MNFKETTYNSSIKYAQGTELNGTVILNTDELGTQEFIIFGTSYPIALSYSDFKFLEEVFNPKKEEKEEEVQKVDSQFVLDFMRLARMESKNIK